MGVNPIEFTGIYFLLVEDRNINGTTDDCATTFFVSLPKDCSCLISIITRPVRWISQRDSFTKGVKVPMDDFNLGMKIGCEALTSSNIQLRTWMLPGTSEVAEHHEELCLVVCCLTNLPDVVCFLVASMVLQHLQPN